MSCPTFIILHVGPNKRPFLVNLNTILHIYARDRGGCSIIQVAMDTPEDEKGDTLDVTESLSEIATLINEARLRPALDPADLATPGEILERTR